MLIKLFRQHCQWSWRRRPLPCLQAAASTASTSSSSRPPRFYCKESLLRGKPGGSTAVEGDELKHLRVLRLKEGDLVELCDGLGNTVECSIVAIDRNRAWVQALQEPQRHPWRGPQWVLAVACTTLKGTRADWLVEKGAELGAHSLIPLLTERSQAGSKAKFRAGGAGADGDGEAYSPGRLERVALAATKQCLRTHAMVLQPPTPLKDLLPLAASSQLSVVGVEGAPPLRSVMDAWAASLNRDGGAPPQRADDGIAAQQRLLIVGPEGDFTPTELQQLVAAGARPVGLGSNRLRTETAAIALLAAAGLYNLTEP